MDVEEENEAGKEPEKEEPSAGSGRRTRAKAGKDVVMDEKTMTPKQKMDSEFAAILATRAPAGANQVSFVALAGKNNSGGVFVPPECCFAFNRGDAEQFEKVKEAIVAKARKWKERCPKIANPFWLIDGGTSVMPLTAVGGVDRGCTEIPTKRSRVADEEVEKRPKRARK